LLDPFRVVDFSEKTFSVMAYSIFAFVEHGNCHGDHFSLCKGKITITVHEPVVKGHERPQRSGIQAVGFDYMIDAAPRSGVVAVIFGDDARRFILVDSLNPGHSLPVLGNIANTGERAGRYS